MAHTIMLVDDDPVNLESLSRIFGRRGYCVQRAGGGEEALSALAATGGNCRLLIADYCMPVVVASGTADAELTQRAHRHGALCLLEKPVDADRLLRLAQEMTRHRDGGVAAGG